MYRLPLLLAFSVAALQAHAAPRVAVDVVPVHSLVARVMAGMGAPDLIVPPGASPHGYALRPSVAAGLAEADLVVWVGPGLTPWLAGPLDALAPEATRLTLSQVPGVELLPIRTGGPFEAHDHEHAAGEAHDDHGHEAAEAHGDHDHDHEAGDAHGEHDHADADERSEDPHLWLDPMNAAAAAAAIATELSALDPANAAAYSANAEAFATEMETLTAELTARLAPLRETGFFVFHDAYQYFEARFEIPAAGSISLNDAGSPGASRVRQLQDRLSDEAIACVFAEPEFEPKLIATLIEGTPVRTGTLDPLGAGLEPGPDLYPLLLRNLATDLVACLEPGS